MFKLRRQEKKTSRPVFDRLKSGLHKTRENFFDRFTHLLSREKIDDSLLEEIETQLLIADMGVPVTSKIMTSFKENLSSLKKQNNENILEKFKVNLTRLLLPTESPLMIDIKKQPFVILVVGVNGTGKTTTIGKLAWYLQKQGKKVMLAAGDTFRAAAIEQLQIWGERNQVPVVAQQSGADSAAVIFDALQSAKSRGFDVLIADTAGRLHTQNHLMEELKKIKKVLGKIDETAPHEILLTLDAGIGQNTLQQAKQFYDTIGVTGIALTKLDGTAKGGVIFAIADTLKIPIRFIGVGEKIDDLQLFKAKSFVEALFE